jgi:hypothetical protein
VRLAVRRASQGQQIPWESTSLEEDFYFIPPVSLKKLSEGELERQFAEEAAQWERTQQSGRIAAVEDYLKRYPSGRFSELAQVRLDRLLAKQGEKKIRLVSAVANPFSKGTGALDMSYRVGDSYIYSKTDLLTKIESRKGVNRVTEVTDEQVVYNKGAMVTDLLGNLIRRRDGASFSPSQMFIGEYSLGKKWTTRYAIPFAKGGEDKIELDLKVVGKETDYRPGRYLRLLQGRGPRLGAGDFAIDGIYLLDRTGQGQPPHRHGHLVAQGKSHLPLRTSGIGGLYPRRLNHEAQQFRAQPHRPRQPQRHAHRQRHRK